MASRTLKKNKRAKYGRTRRQRQRRHQMSGGDLFDFFKPTVETNETCKKKYDKCLDKVAGKEDNNFFKLPTLNFFGSSDSAATTVKGDEGGGEFEMEEYPVAAAPPAEPVSPAPAEPVSPAPAEPVVAAEQEDDADLNLDEITNETLAASAKDVAAEQEQAAAAAAAAEQENADLNLDEITNETLAASANDVAAEQEQAKKMKMSQVPPLPPMMSSSPMMSSATAAAAGGGSRKKYKKRNANRSKKNKNRRNKKRTNKRN
jgi:hypothetical protein